MLSGWSTFVVIPQTQANGSAKLGVRSTCTRRMTLELGWVITSLRCVLVPSRVPIPSPSLSTAGVFSAFVFVLKPFFFHESDVQEIGEVVAFSKDGFFSRVERRAARRRTWRIEQCHALSSVVGLGVLVELVGGWLCAGGALRAGEAPIECWCSAEWMENFFR